MYFESVTYCDISESFQKIKIKAAQGDGAL